MNQQAAENSGRPEFQSIGCTLPSTAATDGKAPDPLHVSPRPDERAFPVQAEGGYRRFDWTGTHLRCPRKSASTFCPAGSWHPTQPQLPRLLPTHTASVWTSRPQTACSASEVATTRRRGAPPLPCSAHADTGCRKTWHHERAAQTSPNHWWEL